ncbi:MAG: ankyrin repeat domain-containing protein [Oligoflexia bacterium]|nr:ankyrin repeat domain-containing protein [Oligoflexia bacterium]
MNLQKIVFIFGFTLISTLTLVMVNLSAGEISKDQLASAIRDRITSVDEYAFIRNWALEQPEASRPQVYLFGGAATAYASYINRHAKKGDLGAADKEIDISDIYDLVQDVDIVIDGTPEQAQELQQQLDKNFPALQGGSDKSLWEVRPLRHTMGPKEALLNNPEIAKQHTDSLSSGFIEITKNSPAHMTEIRDLADWKDATTTADSYLEDVRQGQNSYRFNPKHGETTRAKNGMNPPIISVLRYFIKASQYGAYKIPDESKKSLMKIIANTKASDFENSYVQTWLAYNIKKLFMNASDLNKTWEMLDQYGVRKMLAGLTYSEDKQGGGGIGLADWFNRESLAELLISKDAKVQTIEEYLSKLGYSKSDYLDDGVKMHGWVLSHEVKDYYAFASMTKNPENKINAFISRAGKVGEAAVAGDGFYTVIGTKGASTAGNTGLTIHLAVADPQAKYGIDFKEGAQSNHLVIKNRNMLKVIHEDLSLGVADFLSQILEGKYVEIDTTVDMAVKKKLERTLIRHLKNPSERDIENMIPLISSAFKQGKDGEQLKIIQGTIFDYVLKLKVPAAKLEWPLDYFKSKRFTLSTLEEFLKGKSKEYVEKSFELFKTALADQEAKLGSKVIKMYRDSKSGSESSKWLLQALSMMDVHSLSASDRAEILTLLKESTPERIPELVKTVSRLIDTASDKDFILSLYQAARNGFKGASLLLNQLLDKNVLTSLYEDVIANDNGALKDLLFGATIPLEKQKELKIAKSDVLKQLPAAVIVDAVEQLDYDPGRKQMASLLLQAIENDNINLISLLEKKHPHTMKKIVPSFISKEGATLLRKMLSERPSSCKSGAEWLVANGVSLRDEAFTEGAPSLLTLSLGVLPKEVSLSIMKQSTSWDSPSSNTSPLYLTIKKLSSDQMQREKVKQSESYLNLRELILAMLEHRQASANDYASLLGPAVKSGDRDIIQNILQKGANAAKAVDMNGDPILFEVVKSGDVELFKLLLTAGADPYATNKKGKTLLMAVIEDQNRKRADVDKEFFNLLLNYNNLNVTCDQQYNMDALMFAIKKKDHFYIETLLKKGVDLSHRDATRAMLEAQIADAGANNPYASFASTILKTFFSGSK